MATWQVQQAKSRLSELIEAANTSGPQIITKHGSEAAVVLSIHEFRDLTVAKPNLRDFLLNGPRLGDLPITRDYLSHLRNIDLFDDDEEES